MFAAETRRRTLVDAVVPGSGVLRDALLIAGFVLFTAAAAQIAFYPNPAVPITGQTLAVLLTGAALGRWRGGIAMAAYFDVGLIASRLGIPFLAPAGGIPFASWGYLFGFIAAGFLVGALAERGMDRRFRTALLPMLLGNVVIYLFGLPWLAFFVPLDKVLPWGLFPFIPGDLLKLLLAAGVLPGAWQLVRRVRGEAPGPQR